MNITQLPQKNYANDCGKIPLAILSDSYFQATCILEPVKSTFQGRFFSYFYTEISDRPE